MSKRLDPTRAQLNSTVMIQDIVAILKNPPFNETMTLFSFEEKKEYELFLGTVGDELEKLMSENQDVFRRLKESE